MQNELIIGAVVIPSVILAASGLRQRTVTPPSGSGSRDNGTGTDVNIDRPNDSSGDFADPDQPRLDPFRRKIGFAVLAVVTIVVNAWLISEIVKVARDSPSDDPFSHKVSSSFLQVTVQTLDVNGDTGITSVPVVDYLPGPPEDKSGNLHSNCPIAFTPDQLIGIYGSSFTAHYSFQLSNQSNSDARVQKLFDQGVLHLFGYNYVEAARNFESAASLDATCAMCYWGLAHSKGMHINEGSPLSADTARAGRQYISRAYALVSHQIAHPSEFETMPPAEAMRRAIEIQLIMAQQVRFGESDEDWLVNGGSPHFDRLYAQFMGKLYKMIPSHADISALYAEAVMNIYPWKYYEQSGRSATTLRPELKPALEALTKAMQLSKNQQQLALHLYIHLLESSATPQRAVEAADALVHWAGVDGTTHLQHMPAHIYCRVGRWSDCLTASLQSVAADEAYRAKCLVPYFPGHNRALLVMAALYKQDLHTALTFAPSVYRLDDTMARYIMSVFPVPRELVLSRFGKWWHIVNSPDNFILSAEFQRASCSSLESNGGDSECLTILKQAMIAHSRPPYIMALQLYSSTLAYMAVSDLHLGAEEKNEKARALLEELSATTASIPKDDLPEEHEFYPYHREMGIMLTSIAHARYFIQTDDIDQAIPLIEAARAIQQSFSYIEPENFYLPIAQCLAPLYFHKGLLLIRKWEGENKEEAVRYIQKAVQVYEDDLLDHPLNDWSMKGLTVVKTFLSAVSANNEDISSTSKSQEVGSGLNLRNLRRRQVGTRRRWLSTPLQSAAATGSCCELGFCSNVTE